MTSIQRNARPSSFGVVQSSLHGSGELGAGPYCELAVDPSEVNLDGFWADEEGCSRFAVGRPAVSVIAVSGAHWSRYLARSTRPLDQLHGRDLRRYAIEPPVTCTSVRKPSQLFRPDRAR